MIQSILFIKTQRNSVDFEISTYMVLFFVLSLAVSIWKIYAFLPNKQLEDDDTTKESQEILKNLMIKVIVKNNGDLDNKKLFELIKNDEEFDNKRFWRFNENRLNQLLLNYFLQNPSIKNIKDIYKNVNT
jgi:hypothetical protein